jgi:hypothetical protein
MARIVLLLIKTSSDPVSINNSILSNNTYIEEGIPKPNNLEKRLAWG